MFFGSFSAVSLSVLESVVSHGGRVGREALTPTLEQNLGYVQFGMRFDADVRLTELQLLESKFWDRFRIVFGIGRLLTTVGPWSDG